MKKRLFIILLLSIFCLSGCSKKKEAQETESFGTIEILEDTDESENNEQAEELETDSGNIQTESLSDETDISNTESRPVEETTLPIHQILIEKGETIFDKDGITIVQKGIEENGITGFGVKIEISNNNPFPIVLETNTNVVNELTLSYATSWQIENRETVEKVIETSIDDLEAAGIKDVYQIIPEFTLYNAETYEELDNFEIKIETNNPHEEQDTSIFGDILTQGEYFTVYGKYVNNDEIWGSGFVITVFNETDRTITVQCEKAFADEQYMQPGYSVTCRPNTYATSKQNYLATILRENEQDNFRVASVILTAYDENTGEKLETTEEISVYNDDTVSGGQYDSSEVEEFVEFPWT